MNFPCIQNKVQQLSSGLQECEMMKLNFIIPSSSKSGAMDPQAGDSHICTTLFSSQGKCQVQLPVCEVFLKIVYEVHCGAVLYRPKMINIHVAVILITVMT